MKTFAPENLQWIFIDGAVVGVYEPVSNFIKMIVLSNVPEMHHRDCDCENVSGVASRTSGY